MLYCYESKYPDDNELSRTYCPGQHAPLIKHLISEEHEQRSRLSVYAKKKPDCVNPIGRERKREREHLWVKTADQELSNLLHPDEQLQKWHIILATHIVNKGKKKKSLC